LEVLDNIAWCCERLWTVWQSHTLHALSTCTRAYTSALSSDSPPLSPSSVTPCDVR
jgi:hypothetical protein